MSGLMSMFYTGVSGIFAAQTQIQVTGNNMANINNEAYSRQRVNLASSFVMNSSNGVFGRGVSVKEVTRVYDDLLATTLRNENSSLAFWSNTQTVLSEVKMYFNELEKGSGLGESLTAFFEAWSDLAMTAPDNSDTSAVLRLQVVASAQQFASQMQDSRAALVRMQEDIDYNLKMYVDNINTISESIALLNTQIAQVEAGGQNANELRDQREALLNTLSSYATITTKENANGQVSVFLSGDPLVSGGDSYLLEVQENANGHYDIYWTSGESYSKPVNMTDKISGGVLESMFKSRDDLLQGYIDQLDAMARTLIEEVNKVHASSQGLTRFTQLTSTNAVFNPGYLLSSQSGDLPYDIQAGSFQIHVYQTDEDGNEYVETYTIDVDPTKDTLAGIAEKISAADGNLDGGVIQASVSADGKLTISVANGYDFAFGDDTSNFLVAAGFNCFFSGTDASNINVTDFVADNLDYVATSMFGDVGDNRLADAIARIKGTKIDGLGALTVDEFYGYFIGLIASDKQQSDIFVATKTMTVTQYANKLEEIKGVSMEEEQTNLILFQRVFEANSRYINIVDEMLNTVINNLGLVGR